MTEYKRAYGNAAWSLGIAMSALFIGGFFGPLQKLEHVGINWYTKLSAIGIKSYYQGLTIHGVLNALVWTTFFIVGFFTFTMSSSLKREAKYPKLHTAALLMMAGGVLVAAVPLLLNLATVLFTFYPPLQASPYFYIGLVMVVVGSWMHGWGHVFTWRAWRAENPKTRTPLVALGSVITMVMWQFASLGIAIELLWLVIPWSFGLVAGTDPQLARTFFWFTGHPIVYFWLLPAYVSWYGMMPKQAGGKLFSEPLARLVFWLFLVLSIPVGLHHQYLDPGIPVGWKWVHALLTASLFIPSALTAFNVCASLELGGRSRGGKGLLGWIRNLPWKDPSYLAQNLAMILFVFGGIGGLINASYNVNLVVHNTAWVPGHFHLTVGSAVTLSFFGILYWLVPKLSGRALWQPKLALAQAWTWFVGMILMSNGLHTIGLIFQAPRRTMLGSAAYNDYPQFLLVEAAIGGIILGISGLMFYSNMLGTVFAGRKFKAGETIVTPEAEPLDPTPAPVWLDQWKPWIAVTLALIVLAYGPVLFYLISNLQMMAPGVMVK
jgi:cytochrome c oxidase subunit 1